MSLIHPFAALRPPASLVPRVSVPPYDVVSSAEARAYAKGNAASYFRVSRPEVDLPDGTDEHADEVYARGRINLEALVADGTLLPDPRPCLYVYAQKMGDHRQVGLVACASVAEYDAGRIRKHELTRADKEEDRTRHIDALAAHDEPVFLTYRTCAEVDGLVANVTASPPEVDFTTEDEVRHTLWVVPVSTGARLVEAFARVDGLYIADGHHRSAAASRVHALRAGRPGEHDRFLAVIFPHNQMRIMAYNRVVKDLNGHSPQALLKALEERFALTADARPVPSQLHDVAMYLDGRWWNLRARPGSWPDTPVGRLDVSILQNGVLDPLLGIREPRTDKRIQFVGGIRGTQELERVVAGGQGAVAFSLVPTRLEDLMAIADASEIMPPKSTWFEPKLRSGLLLHRF